MQDTLFDIDGAVSDLPNGQKEKVRSPGCKDDDLRDYLASNLHLIEPGLQLYRAPDGRTGVEFPIGGRRIGILAIDKDGTPVILELKVRRGHERTIGQAWYYKALVKRLLNAPRVRIIIVAREVLQGLGLAVERVADCEIFEYKLRMVLKRVTGSSP